MKLSKDILIRHLAITFLVLIAVVVLLWVVCKVFGAFNFEEKEATLVIAFFGILATFVVVTNYAQVVIIKSELDSKQIEMDNEVTNLKNTNSLLSKRLEILNSELIELYEALSNPTIKALGSDIANSIFYHKDELYNISFLEGEYDEQYKTMKAYAKLENENLVFVSKDEKKPIFNAMFVNNIEIKVIKVVVIHYIQYYSTLKND